MFNTRSLTVSNNGTKIMQSLNSDPGLAISQDNLERVDCEGTLRVNTHSDDDYLGFVFSYNSSSKFYVVMWKKHRKTYYDEIHLLYLFLLRLISTSSYFFWNF